MRAGRVLGLRGEEGIAEGPPIDSPPIDDIELKLLPASRRRVFPALRSSFPCPEPEKSTRPFRAGLPLRLRKAAKSFASLSLVVVGRTGEGDVARNNIRSAASVSLGG